MEPSTTYRFAKNPKQALRSAVLRTIEERSDNPRKVWNALVTSSRIPQGLNSLTSGQFCEALKHFGTGIQLTETDVEILFGPENIDYGTFASFVAHNSI